MFMKPNSKRPCITARGVQIWLQGRHEKPFKKAIVKDDVINRYVDFFFLLTNNINCFLCLSLFIVILYKCTKVWTDLKKGAWTQLAVKPPQKAFYELILLFMMFIVYFINLFINGTFFFRMKVKAEISL